MGAKMPAKTNPFRLANDDDDSEDFHCKEIENECSKSEDEENMAEELDSDEELTDNENKANCSDCSTESLITDC